MGTEMRYRDGLTRENAECDAMNPSLRNLTRSDFVPKQLGHWIRFRRGALRASHRISVARESVPKGDRFKFDPNGVHDGNHRSRLEFKSGQHRAKLVNRQWIVTVQHH
jgi:hypothetical protein